MIRCSTTRRNIGTLFHLRQAREPTLFSHSSISQHHDNNDDDDFASDLNPSSSPEDSGNGDDVTFSLSSILRSPLKNGCAPQETGGKEKQKGAVGLPWLQDMKKEVTCERKQNYTCKSRLLDKKKKASRERKLETIVNYTNNDCFDSLAKMCIKQGTRDAVDLFGNLGGATGVKEYNALIKVCIKNARETDDENVAIE